MKWFGVITLAVVVVSAGLDIVFRHHGHPVFWWHAIPAFDVLFGLLGFVVLGLGATRLGSMWIQHKTNYYPEESS
jgi:hypothetical protein